MVARSCKAYIAADGWLDFWDFVVLKRHNDCWPWVGTTLPSGYGKFNSRGEWFLAHRRSYELEHGEIPTGLIVRHSCDNPSCVNPRHLLVGTHKDNTQDMIARGRDNFAGRGSLIFKQQAAQ
jgi:hypothetical protein